MKRHSKWIMSAVFALVLMLAVLPAKELSAKSGGAKATAISFETTTGGDFVAGQCDMKITFTLEAAAKNVKVKVVDSDDKVVFSKTVKACKKNKAVSVKWNGKNAKGKKYVSEGVYSVKIASGKAVTASNDLDVAKGSFMFIRNSGFDGGDGSAKNPYKISNLDQLKKTEAHNGRCFEQTADIDVDYGDFSGMFGENNQFTGTYDGKNHTISNAILVEGVFHYIGEGGEVNNLILSGFNVTGNYTGVVCRDNFGTIKNCKVYSCNVSQGASVIDGAALGGIACGNYGKINNCEVTGLTVMDGSEDTLAGAVCADNRGNIIQCSVSDIDIKVKENRYFTHCTWVGALCGKNTGNITYSSVENADLAGYIVGLLVGGNSGVVSGCTPVSSDIGLIGEGNPAA